VAGVLADETNHLIEPTCADGQIGAPQAARDRADESLGTLPRAALVTTPTGGVCN